MSYSEIDLTPAEIIVKLEADVADAQQAAKELKADTEHYFDRYIEQKAKVKYWQAVATSALEVIKHLQSDNA